MATGNDLAEQLLRRAVDDEAAARAMLPLKPVTDAIVGFHAQQAVEKSLKAVLAPRNVDFPFIHDLGGLVDLCEEAGESLLEGLNGVDRLRLLPGEACVIGARLDGGELVTEPADTFGGAQRA
jgi:HEPN domain-containing protein